MPTNFKTLLLTWYLKNWRNYFFHHEFPNSIFWWFILRISQLLSQIQSMFLHQRTHYTHFPLNTWRHMRQLYHAKVYHNKLKLWLYRHKTRTSRWKGKNLMNHLCASIKDLICWKYVFSCIYFQIWNQNWRNKILRGFFVCVCDLFKDRQIAIKRQLEYRLTFPWKDINMNISCRLKSIDIISCIKFSHCFCF